VEFFWTCNWTKDCQCSCRPLMMGGVLPETSRASYEYGIIKYWYTVAFFGFFFMNYGKHQSWWVVILL
jgi:hypothetical protein